MAIKINSVKVVTEFVNDETGEIFVDERVLGEETKKVKSSTRSRKPKDDGDPNPKATLLEGKIQLNKAAVDLTGFEPEMKIDIKFEKQGRKNTPVMMEASSGNRLTKTYTISCRGSKHDNLAEFGDTFDIIPYEGKEGYFKLMGNIQQEDDIIDVPEELNIDDGIDIGDIDFDL